MHPPDRCERIPADSLTTKEVESAIAFCKETSGQEFEPAYLRERLTRYQDVRRAWVGSALTALMLTEGYALGESTVVYIGPTFSRRGACVALFVALVAELFDAGLPFTIAFEAENPRILTMIATLFPRSSNIADASIRERARRAMAAIPHVRGFDPTTMTSEVVEPLAEAHVLATTYVS